MKWTAAVVIGLALLGALGPGAGSEARAQGLAKWKMGVVFLKADSAFQLMGRERGYAREMGLDVEVVALPGDAQALQGLIAGHVDAVEITPAGPLAAMEKGAKLKIVASFMPGLAHVLYVRKEVEGLRDLYGKPVAVSALGSLPHVVVVALLEKHGLDAKRLTWVQAGGDADRLRALLAGKVMGTVSTVEFLPMIQRSGQAKLLMAMRDELPEWPRNAAIANDRAYTERAGLLQMALNAQAKGIRFAVEHKDETVALMAKLGKVEPKEVDWLYDWFVKNKTMQPNGYLRPEAIQWTQELNLKLKRQTRILPMEQVATWEFQQRLVAELGTYPW
ncbi:MAG: ABC transporter substrate-binding protein [Deltaproteobacteria bacterium]|nr:ABC transporter substrate-binding protein [Deltaproteobacteria bacterium]